MTQISGVASLVGGGPTSRLGVHPAPTFDHLMKRLASPPPIDSLVQPQLAWTPVAFVSLVSLITLSLGTALTAQTATIVSRGTTPEPVRATVAGVRVSGLITLGQNRAIGSAVVSLQRQATGGGIAESRTPARLFPNGAFFFIDVPPGDYRLRATGQAIGNDEVFAATRVITVGPTHLSNLQLILTPTEGPAVAGPPAASEGGGPQPPPAGTATAIAGTAAGPTMAPEAAAALASEMASDTIVESRTAGGVTVRATRILEPVVVDGKLEDDVYSEVPSIGGFVQQLPQEGGPPTEKTDLWIFFDDENVYISARCWDSRPERIIANEMRRDNFGIAFQNDNIGVVLDTFNDRRNAFMFSTNPIGGLFDAYVTDERETNRDWNTVWYSSSQRFEDGWTVEMAIPFKSLRYKAGASQVWGINVRRVVRSKNEFNHLTQVPASYGGRGLQKISSAATLVGIEPPAGSKNLEIKPYALSDVVTDRTEDPAVSNDFGANVGVDVKYGLTQSLIADFTYNTDFAQVEDDEEQVNLTRFSLFFPEKREFFLEGQGIFAFGPANRGGGFRGRPNNTPVMFFSRRIGLSDDGVVPIQAGARLTGRAGRYSIGLLNIGTEAVAESDLDATNFTVVRLKRDILRRSNIGLIGTNRSVAIEADGSNQVFGVDANFAFYQNLRMNAYYAETRTDELDGDDLSYLASLDYAADRYGVVLEHLAVGENFNPEVGFVRRDDMRRDYAELRFSPRPRSIRAIRKVGFEPAFEYITDGTGLLETRQAQFSVRFEFENGDRWNTTYEDTFERLDEEFDIADDVIVPVGDYGFRTIRTNYRLGPQRKISGGLTFQRGGFFGGDRTDARYEGRIEVTPQLSVEPNLSWSWVDLPQGSFTTRLVGVRTNVTVSPRTLIGALVQYNSSDDSVSANVRFRWEYQPGSDLFLVYSEDRDTARPRFPLLTNRSVILKFTRLFRF